MEKTNLFGRFDVVSDDSDHQFLRSNNGHCFSNSKSEVYKAIMREWKTLEQNLPESIYVRVYERRIDLMRAVIVGAAGTPYHDGLFFFDIAFPSDYPKHPPLLHFHSFGLRVNPNLYTNGRVCLSLLNTWIGNKREKWDPCESTLLQVLLSIQGLVLNEKPFFNEPGYERERFVVLQSKSRAYNELVFALTCNISLYLLRRPPRNFETFVRGHFRERAIEILAACNEYARGRVSVGYYSYASSSNSSNVEVSQEFKERMKVSYPKLVKAFRSNGAFLDSFLQSERSEDKSKGKGEQSKNKSSRIFKKAVEKIKRALGWKKRGKSKGN